MTTMRYGVASALLTLLMCLLISATEQGSLPLVTSNIEDDADLGVDALFEECSRTTRPPLDRRADKQTLTFGTFNTDYLFDGMSPHVPPYHGDTEAADLHIRKISAAIGGLNIDILNLVEVQNCGVIQRVAANLDGTYKGYLIPGVDYITHQNVALLTRVDPLVGLARTDERANFPVSGSQCGWMIPSDTTVSKNYVTVFNITGFPVPVAAIAAHLVAFPLDPPRCSQREGQARVLQREIRSLIHSGTEVIVLGDFNDYSAAPLDCEGHLPTSQVLRMLSDVDDDGELELQNVMQHMVQSERFTGWYGRTASGSVQVAAIDHILLTKRLWDRVDDAWIDHSFLPADNVSDHWPVVVKLNLSAPQPWEDQ